MADRSVDVYVCLGTSQVKAGRLWSHRRNVESMTFQYSESYLAFSEAYPLDPDLPLVSFAQQTAPGREIFGAFYAKEDQSSETADRGTLATKTDRTSRRRVTFDP